ncbi:MAG: AAA family ATPase [Oscillatoria sp. SIO1A7]|nr:AAA family ATPase [Oscillatoria sp. SIO1A7]
MKVQSIALKYFKAFENREFDFTHEETGLARDLILIIGSNGSGKTSILQAISATLGVATGRLKRLSDLEWPGFNYELLASNWGRVEPEVSLKVQFSSKELQAIREFQEKLQDLEPETPENGVLTDGKHIVNLKWRNGIVEAENATELLQFKGRQYAKRLLRSEGFEAFERVGTALWYTEQRTSTSLTSEDPEQKLEITDDMLRDRLSKLRQFHQFFEDGKIQQLRPGQKDLYAEIEKAYKTIFPKRSFEGPFPREGIDDILSEPWFYLYDGKKQYEISEMSGGERATFPMLMDFASWNIHNSVILIDELELHLHPPMQQALLRALPDLGKNNQFIVTTHSDRIEQLIPEAYIIRLEVQ